MAERVLGLDVGTSAVRVVEVVHERPGGKGRPGRGTTVSRVGEVPLPPGAVRDGEVVDPAAVGSAIAELWRQTGLRPRDVRVGLTGSRVVVRVIDMPAMPDEDMAGAVRFSAADHIPIPLDEAVLDHAVLEPAPPGEPGGPPMVKVLVAATHRSALDGLLAAVSAGGLRAVAVDLVPFALIRALSVAAHAARIGGTPADPRDEQPAAGDVPMPGTEDDSAEPAPVAAEAIVSVGAALTTVVVHEAGRPRFVRTVQAGGDMLTTAISEELGIDLEAAEGAKRDGAGDLGSRAARIVELRLATILGEIQSSLAYWIAQAERPLRRIVLTGGGARAGDIAGRLALLVGAPVETGVVQGLEAPESAAGAGDWADHTVAAGLALGTPAGGWRIDLCPPVKRSFRITGEMGRRLAAAAAVTVVILGGLSVRSVLSVGQERERLAAQQKATARIEAEIAQFSALRKLSTDLDAGRRRVQSALAGDVSWTRFLDELVRSMPSGVWLQSLNLQASTGPAAATSPTAAAAAPLGGVGSMQLTAAGLDFPDVADWLQKVGADPSLSGLTIGGATINGLGPQATVAFTSTATITPAARSDRASRLMKAAL